MRTSAYVEQVYLGEELADSVFREADRLGVSRSAVCRDALRAYLNLPGEERHREVRTGRNYGRKGAIGGSEVEDGEGG